MGTQPFVNSDHSLPTSPTKVTQSKRDAGLHIDAPLLVVMIFLLVIGMLMVYSASWNYGLWNYQSAGYVLGRQLVYMVIGGISAFTMSRMDYHRFQIFGLPIMLVTLLLLVVVLVINDTRYGAIRTLFGGSIQPSELSKLAIIIYLSVWLYSKHDQISSLMLGLLPMAVILGITSALIMLQPDYSATLTVIILGGILFFLADGDARQIVLLVGLSALFGWIVINVSSTGHDRVESFWLGRQEPEFASYHIRRSLEAIVHGDIIGVGIGKGVSKFTGLPVPWTDSIFTVIIEETGIVGACAVIGLYLMLLWRGLRIAQRAPDQLGKLLAGGLTLWITLEAMINMSVMVNMIPFAGNALPLISYGGSSLVTTMTAIGIIMSVSRFGMQEKTPVITEGRLAGAVVDLRRRYRRRRIPSPVSSDGTPE